jgi:hypothetical protein
VSDTRDVEGDPNSSSESTTVIVSRLRSYRADELEVPHQQKCDRRD